jgi:hypothetical protein
MSLVEVLGRIRAAGLTVRLDGPDLVLSPRSKLAPDLCSEILAHKPALLAVLQSAVVCASCGGWSLQIAVDSASFGYPPGRLYWCSNHTSCGQLTWQEGQ